LGAIEIRANPAFTPLMPILGKSLHPGEEPAWDSPPLPAGLRRSPAAAGARG
jgi:hypothetical protein